ncbi:MAG: VCBS repeat-containing protein [Gammaproteobacteria bacterium]|nr:VCBS repeat-containing protein [Gammaproteobacteria bacterium]
MAMSTKAIKVFRMLLLGLLLLGAASVVRAQTTPLSDLDALRYIASHPDLIAAFGPDAAKGRSHYETWGIKEGRKITFNPLNYIASHPDLIAAFGADAAKGVRHYIQNGHAERRQITFDPNRYMASYPDLIQAFAGDETKAARHYIEWGYKEQRQTTFTDLDALQYVASFGDLIQSIGSDVVTAIRHYVTTGYNAGRRITFDALAYIASFGDLISAFGTNAISGVQHYINWGFREGRQVVFDALGYLSRHTDLQQAFGSDTVAATKHYINWGFKEGRAYSFTVAVNTGAGGRSNISKIFVESGKTTSISLTPDSGFTIDRITGCGGSLRRWTYTTGVVTASCVISASFRRLTEEEKIFSGTFVALPPINNLVSGICTEASKQGGLPIGLGIADLNGDGRKDIVTSYFCGYSKPGEAYDGPTPNTLITFLSQPDGSYVLGNEKLFGSALIDIGGLGSYYTVADFNNDGRSDVGIGVSKEDGRGTDGSVDRAWGAPPVVLLSRPGGMYSVERLPTKAPGPKVQAVDNEVGGVDFVYQAVPREPSTAYRWVAGSWMKIGGYATLNTGMLYFTRPYTGSSSKTAVSVSTEPSDGPASVQVTDKIGEAWVITSKFVFPSQRVSVIGWNSEPSVSNLVNANGVRMIYSTIEESCVGQLQGEPVLFSRLGGFRVPGDWDGISTLDERKLPGIALLLAFKLQGGLVPMPSAFEVPHSGEGFTTFDCKDVNGDNLTDVVVNIQGAFYWGSAIGGPVFFLNDGRGKLVKTWVPGLPAMPQDPSKGWVSSTSAVDDMNGDGIADLVYYSPSPIENPLGHSFRIYLGKKTISLEP